MSVIRKIKLKYTNSLGEVLFDRENWHLTGAEGLAMPRKQISAVSFANKPGRTTLSCTDSPRTITLSGDVNVAKNGESEISRGLAILNSLGVLWVETNEFKRKIDARCVEFSVGERMGEYRSFVAQFVCDLPYFQEENPTETVIFEKVPLLSKDTVLPAVLSTRIAMGDHFYSGGADTEPKILIEVPDGSGIITIRNVTTGGCVELSYDSKDASSITIDMENRTVTDDSGNLRYDLLTDDSFFEGFYLCPGNNRIEVEDTAGNRNIVAKMTYKVCYPEAIV